MSFFSKLFGKKDDDFSTSSFDAGLPPAPDTTQSYQTAGQQQSGAFPQSSSNVASFMEKTGDDLTGLPPFDAEQPAPTNPFQTQPSHSESLSGQQLAHNYMQDRQPPQAASPQSSSTRSADHSLELINVKLDAIRSELSSISQRIDRLEQKKW
jgi:hypothetical protein